MCDFALKSLNLLAGFGVLGEPLPKQYEFARLNLTYTVLSKRRLIQLVQYSPSTATLFSLSFITGFLSYQKTSIVNASLIVYPSFYKIDPCHALRHLNTVMVEASTIGSRFVDHPDDLAQRDQVRGPRQTIAAHLAAVAVQQAGVAQVGEDQLQELPGHVRLGGDAGHRGGGRCRRPGGQEEHRTQRITGPLGQHGASMDPKWGERKAFA